MRALLGAIVAGGRATRFGSDKAASPIDGVALLDHVANGLRGQVDALVVVGREWPGLQAVDDAPRRNLGPLGGLCGALRYAVANRFDAVITTPCDLLPVPDFARLIACGGPAYLAGHNVCGIWPSDCLPALERFIAVASTLSMWAWIAETGAIAIASTVIHSDFNTPDALASFIGRT